MRPDDYTYPPGYTTDWIDVGEIRIGWACLLIDGIAVLTPLMARQEARYVVDTSRVDFWGYRRNTGHYEYRTV